MQFLRYVLIADGTSDRVLLHILTWFFQRQDYALTVEPRFESFNWLSRPPRDLRERMEMSLEHHNCDLLCVHRDAEASSHEERKEQVLSCYQELSRTMSRPMPPLCIIPVRMTEAWFLFDEPAIRRAAGNPNGRTPLNLPDVRLAEGIADPKQLLHNTLRNASELSGRRLRRFRVEERFHRLAELIADFSPLRVLPAFQSLETDLRVILGDLNSQTGATIAFGG